MNEYHNICMTCMNKYVAVQTNDGLSHDGFVAHVDNDHVILAIPTEEMMTGSHSRQFGFYPGFYPRRRFVPRRIPLAAITALYLLPFFI